MIITNRTEVNKCLHNIKFELNIVFNFVKQNCSVMLIHRVVVF